MVDLGELRRLACQGVPDDAGVRPIVWKVWELSRLLRIILFTVCLCGLFGTCPSVCSLTHSHARDMTLAIDQELDFSAMILVDDLVRSLLVLYMAGCPD